MQILMAEYAGFCEGVERAYRIALEQTKTHKQIFMLGNLVHNTQVVRKFEELGARIVKAVSEIPQGTDGIIIISAHGVSPLVYDEINKKGLELVDTTCPWVKNAQKLSKNLAEKGIQVIVVGDKNHPEVKGIVAWSGGRALVVEEPEGLASIKLAGKVGVIAQTTQSEANFDKVVEELKEKTKDIIIHKTICGATSKRQKAAIDIAKKVDLMLVIGDLKSANTNRLTELCKKTGAETHQIQTALELDGKWLAGKAKIGITAGASTPDWVIDEVIKNLGNQENLLLHNCN